MKNKYLLLFLLFSTSLFSQNNIAVKSFIKVENDMTARIEEKKVDQNGEVCAIIKIETTQTGFSWESDALGIVAAVPKVGEYWLYVPHGAKRLTIKHSQLGILRDYMYPLPIEKATVYVLSLISGKITTIVEETIASQWLVINPEPSDAAVYIDDVFVKTGSYAAKRKPGSYKYRVEAPSYHTAAGNIDITNKKEELNLKLIPAYGYISVTTEPDTDAKVIIDGKNMTQNSPCKSEALSSGEHIVRVIKDMYQPIAQKVMVVDNQTTTVNFILQPNFAEISITIPDNATLYVNNTKKGIGNWTGRLGAGIYSVEVRLEKHQSAKQDIEVVAGEKQTIDLKPTPIYGSLDVITSPGGASISISGKDYGTTPNTINNLLIGDYAVRLSKDGFNTETYNISIEDGKNTVVNESLKTGRSITINSTPSGVNLYIDEAMVGQTPFKGSLAYGSHNLKIEQGERKLEKMINIEADGGENNFNLSFNSHLINITSNPDNASVSIDGKMIGNSPLNTNLTYGKHSIELTSGDKSIKQDLDVDSNSSPNLFMELVECNSTKKIISSPSGATIYINNNVIGTTPFTYNMMHRQESIELKQTGYLPYKETLNCNGSDLFSAGLTPNNQYSVQNEAQLKSTESALLSARNTPKAESNYTDRTYMLYTYDSICPIGISIGSLLNNSLGAYFSCGINTDIFTSENYFTIDNAGNHSGSVFDDVRPTGEIANGYIDATLGLTAKLFHPVWAYAGGGIAYNPVWWEVKRYYDDGDFFDTSWVRNTDETKWLPVFETGLIIDIGGFILRGGFKTQDFSAWNISLGLGFGI